MTMIIASFVPECSAGLLKMYYLIVFRENIFAEIFLKNLQRQKQRYSLMKKNKPTHIGGGMQSAMDLAVTKM